MITQEQINKAAKKLSEAITTEKLLDHKVVTKALELTKDSGIFPSEPLNEKAIAQKILIAIGSGQKIK